MIAESHDPQLVVALEQLKKAFAIYDRSWFYIDPSKSQELVFEERLSYVEDFKVVEKVLKGRVRDRKNPTKKSQVLVCLHYLSSRILATYHEAWWLLCSRNDYSIKEYSESRKKANKQGIQIYDRDIKSAHLTTDELNKEFQELEFHIAESLVSDLEQDKWCGYEIEFGLLNGRCRLMMDEIRHIGAETDRLQDLFISNKQISSAKKSLQYAAWGIIASASLSLISLFVTLSKSSSPVVVMNEAPASTNLELAIEVRSLSSEIGNLREKLIHVGATENDASREIISMIKRLETALNAEPGPFYMQTKRALSGLEDSLGAILDAKTNTLLPSVNIQYDDLLLRDDVRSVREAVVDLRSAIEKMEPSQIIFEGDSISKRALIKLF